MLFDWLRHPAFLTGLVLQAVLVLVAIGAGVIHELTDFEAGMLIMLAVFALGMIIFWVRVERYFRSLPEDEREDLIHQTWRFRNHIMLLASGVMMSALLALFGWALNAVFLVILYMFIPLTVSNRWNRWSKSKIQGSRHA